MNADDPVAIDVHAHAGEPCRGPRDDYYRERRIGAAIFPVGAERETGFRRHSNEEVARVAAENADIPSPFAAIDPAKGRAGWCARRAFAVKGFKFHPTMQGFVPNDPMAHPLCAAIAQEGAIALFHGGQAGVGSGIKGGMGMRPKYANPMHVDGVAVDFPDMPIVPAHPSFPWTEEGLAVAQHDPETEDAGRLGPAGDHPRPLAAGCRDDRHPRGGEAAAAEGERPAASEDVT